MAAPRARRDGGAGALRPLRRAGFPQSRALAGRVRSDRPRCGHRDPGRRAAVPRHGGCRAVRPGVGAGSLAHGSRRHSRARGGARPVRPAPRGKLGEGEPRRARAARRAPRRIRTLPGRVRNTADEVAVGVGELRRIGADRVIIVDSKAQSRRLRAIWRALVVIRRGPSSDFLRTTRTTKRAGGDIPQTCSRSPEKFRH